MNKSNHNEETISELSSFYDKNPSVKLDGGKEENIKMRQFFYRIAIGGKEGNKLEFELSENDCIREREQTLSDMLDENQNLFESSKNGDGSAKNMLTEAFRLFMERGNVYEAFRIKKKQGNVFEALLSVLIVPKAIATALFGILAVLSSGDLIKLASVVFESNSGLFFPVGMFTLFVLYFGLIDFRYLRPRILFKDALLRGIYPAALLFFYTFVFLFLLAGLLGLNQFLLINSMPYGFDYFRHVMVITFVSGIFALLLQSLWDKESILRPV